MDASMLNESAFSSIALPSDVLARIVESIAKAVSAKQIYVFGSYARGEESADSDLDLYVVSDEASGRFEQAARIGRSLLWMGMPKDVVVSSRSRFAERAKDVGSLESVVQREGVLIYG